MRNTKIRGVSLFSSAGIAELTLREVGVEIKVACELIDKRAQLYKALHPDTEMIVGDISSPAIKRRISSKVKANDCKFLLATPPCQGMSTLGKKDYSESRNLLVLELLEIIDSCDFDYVLIENVPKFLKLLFPLNEKCLTLEQLMKEKYSGKYRIESLVLNARNHKVPQSRPRGFLKMWKHGKEWPSPKVSKPITLEESIGNLPSIEAGESTPYPYHYAKEHNKREILAMRYTPEGKSAMTNKRFYPRKPSGERIKGFHNTYKRMRWDQPSPARAMNSGSMGGHNNVHPGRPKRNGTYSDARVLTLRELMIVSSIPVRTKFPKWCTDSFLRNVIGEAIPPRFCSEVIKPLFTSEKPKNGTKQK